VKRLAPAVILGLAGSLALGNVLPARRAARVNPALAMRCE
jgi:hypothetical protein